MKPPITDVTEARQIAAQWQSSGSIGRHLASLASGCRIDRWRVISDIEATKRESPGMSLDDWMDLDRLTEWAKVSDSVVLSGPPGTIRVITNNHERLIVDWRDLTTEEQSAFGYGDDEQWLDDREFVRYRGDVIDITDRDGVATGELGRKGWDSYQSDSFFSGLVFRYADADYDHVIVGRYIA